MSEGNNTHEEIEPTQEELEALRLEEEERLRDEEVDALLAVAIKNDNNRAKAEKYLKKVDKSLGICALEAFNSYDHENIIESIVHYMRWEPHYLFECSVEQLHEYEMALSAHVTFVQAKENQWRVMCNNANRDLKRAVKLAAGYCQGKSVGEREAFAISKYSTLKETQDELDIFNIYREKCEHIADTLTQMDNSLKKTLERRRHEVNQDRQPYTQNRNNNNGPGNYRTTDV